MACIPQAEKLSRQRSNQSSLGTFAMEGLTPDAATLALMQDFEQGDLTLEQFSAAMDSHAQKLFAAQRTAVGAT
jgi:hypothetical protein